MGDLKLYVWEDVLADWTSGMVCILAKNEKQAYELLYEEDSVAWSQLMGIWEPLGWSHPEIDKLSKKGVLDDDGRPLSLTALQRIYLGNKLYPHRLKARVIIKPEAFVVHGGG